MKPRRGDSAQSLIQRLVSLDERRATALPESWDRDYDWLIRDAREYLAKGIAR